MTNLFDQQIRMIVLSEQLIQHLKRIEAIRTPAVEDAFRAVARHRFLPDTSLEDAYTDQVVVLKQVNGVTESSASMPLVVATMLEALDLQPGQRVLEIGSGTGYNAALIAHLVGDQHAVVTIEIDPMIARQALINLREAGFDELHAIQADGAAGYPDAAPYDRISITVGLPDIPWTLVNQMTEQGRLVLPLWIQGMELVIAFDRADDALHSSSISQHSFVRLQGAQAAGEGWAYSKQVAGLRVTRNPHDQINSLQLAESLLTGTYSEIALPLTLAEESFADGLLIWIALHDSDTRLLTAVEEAVSLEILPYFIGESGRVHQTIGLLHGGSLALLASDPVGESGDHPIRIRLYGDDQAVQDRLVRHIEAWQAHGTTLLKHLTIEAHRSESGTILRCRWKTASQENLPEVMITLRT